MAKLSVTGLLLLLFGTSAVVAQDEPAEPDLTLPPTIDVNAEPSPTHLEPAPEEREDTLEVIVTGGRTEFRLPDLGTSFREEAEARDSDERIEVTFLNLFDPENQDPAEEIFPSLEDQIQERFGVGFLRIFKIDFGRRSDE